MAQGRCGISIFSSDQELRKSLLSVLSVCVSLEILSNFILNIYLCCWLIFGVCTAVHSLSENYEDITCCDQSEGLKQDHEQTTSPWWGTLNSVKVCVAARQPRKIDFKRHKPDSRENESWKMKIQTSRPTSESSSKELGLSCKLYQT